MSCHRLLGTGKLRVVVARVEESTQNHAASTSQPTGLKTQPCPHRHTDRSRQVCRTSSDQTNANLAAQAMVQKHCHYHANDLLKRSSLIVASRRGGSRARRCSAGRAVVALDQLPSKGREIIFNRSALSLNHTIIQPDRRTLDDAIGMKRVFADAHGYAAKQPLHLHQTSRRCRAWMETQAKVPDSRVLAIEPATQDL